MKRLILYLWELPQNLLGLLLVAYFQAEKKEGYLFSKGLSGAISLGRYIITSNEDETVIKHEQGHQKQSRLLGWLYLLVIGLPSILWAMFHGKLDYYSFYTERWADKLGGVERCGLNGGNTKKCCSS